MLDLKKQEVSYRKSRVLSKLTVMARHVGEVLKILKYAKALGESNEICWLLSSRPTESDGRLSGPELVSSNGIRIGPSKIKPRSSSWIIT